VHRPRVCERDEEEEEHRRREYDLEVWYRYEPPGIHSLAAFRFSREKMCEFAILLIKAYVLFCKFHIRNLYLDIVLDYIILYYIIFYVILFLLLFYKM